MPRRKRKTYKKPKLKRAYAARHGPRNQLVSLRNPIAKRAIVKLRYCTGITINPTSGLTGSHVFHASGMYDPDITGTGHQPLGFDQWMTFYDHYTVIGSRIHVNFQATAAGATTGASVVGIRLSDSQATSNSITLLTEQGSTSYRYLTDSDAKAETSVIKSFSAKKYFGTKNVIDREDLKGSSSANPAEGAFYEVFVGPYTGSQDISETYAYVTISYIAILTEPRQLAQS